MGRRCTKRAVPPAYAKVWENSDTYRVHCCVLSGPEGKGDGGVILVCQLCGQYAQHNTVGLAAPCPVSAGKDIGVSVQQRLRRCARDQHLGFGRSVFVLESWPLADLAVLQGNPCLPIMQ